MSTKITTETARSIASMRAAADRSLRRRFRRLRGTVVVLVVLVVVLGLLAWPEIQRRGWVQEARSWFDASAGTPKFPVVASSVTDGFSDLLAARRWSSWTFADGEAALVAEVDVQRSTKIEASTRADVWFLFPADQAAPPMSRPLTYSGMSYNAVQTQDHAITTGGKYPESVFVLACGSRPGPQRCSGYRMISNYTLTPGSVPVAVADIASYSDGSSKVLSAAALDPLDKVSICAIVSC